jgi:hypothetical protein
LAEKDVKYHIPKRDLAKKELRRLKIEEGLTDNQLSERTGIPLRSVQRYLAEIYREENTLMTNPTPEEIATQTNIIREQFLHQRQLLMNNIILNPNCDDWKAKVDAMQLSTDLLYAAYKLMTQPPAWVITHTPKRVIGTVMPSNNNSFVVDPTVKLIEENKT